ncbi:MAG: RusA family crossover junction endodeoxyribonuclease, partial [Acidimicrobiales bacterium]
PMTGPVAVALRFTLRRPASAPKRRRTWPIGARSGDIDKLQRAILDALTDVGVWKDDAQVVHVDAGKDYQGADGYLDRPGVTITVRLLDEGMG